ncbi:MAG: phosphatidylglycerol lysyltransferase domain-containing protein [Candidatus Omnitrophica bacterium]|nr:phosphatidylglycerol lysyltransferase domain-containing protein [Candidatus Omnitrophota bacterium]
MRLNDLSFKDKTIFDKYLRLSRHDLSTYAFENIYIWKGLFDIKWQIINDSLCVFFKDNIGAFLYLSPLAKELNISILNKVFDILDRLNKNKEVSRIENIEEKNITFYKKQGFEVRPKAGDYLCLRSEVALLKGNRFKSKRASLNFFTKHYNFEYLPFSTEYKDEVLRLHRLWRDERKKKNENRVYQYMLDDSSNTLIIALDNFTQLNLSGRLVKIDSKLKGFTLGYSLNKNTFCILYEITDLSIKGLAQFIFAKFCQDLKDYKYINIMDDSDLENLKRVKLSYHPVKFIPSYIVKRTSG